MQNIEKNTKKKTNCGVDGTRLSFADRVLATGREVNRQWRTVL